MIGESPLERARCRELDRVAELGVLLPVARIVHATSSPFGLPPNPAVAEFYGAYVQKSLGFLDGKLADGRPFVAGDRPTVGDCTLQAAFQFARYGQVDVLKDHEHLASWDAAFRDRESARAVLMLQDFLVGRVTAAPHR
jgi:glutathione S-transferase